MSYHTGNEAMDQRRESGPAHRLAADVPDPGDGERRAGHATVPGEPAMAGSPQRSPGELVTAMAATPNELGRVIEGETRERLARPASDGDWGVVEILPYLADWEEVITAWTRRWLNEESPVLGAVDDSLWAIEHDYAGEDPFAALERFAAARHDQVEVLRGLDDAGWARTAVHPMQGRMTLHQFVAWICDHDARYLAQARDALA